MPVMGHQPGWRESTAPGEIRVGALCLETSSVPSMAGRSSEEHFPAHLPALPYTLWAVNCAKNAQDESPVWPLQRTRHVCCRTGTDLYRELDRCSIGDEVDLEVLRGNDKVHLKVTLGTSS